MLIVGNWKMNLGQQESAALATSLHSSLPSNLNVEVWVAPSFTSLSNVKAELKNSSIHVGAQNVHWEEKGAFTGEISVSMLKECGCEFVITGHSERRHMLGESNELVAKRTINALNHNLKTILCVGETLEQRNIHKTELVLDDQLSPIFTVLSHARAKNLIIAYEPVWAIGTGKVASIQQIEETHAFIANLQTKYCPDLPDLIPILYGGSVTPENFPEISKIKNVSGALVGGASLKADLFIELVKIAGH